MSTFKKLISLLSYHERRKAGLILIMALVMGLLDAVGVASILPFISILANPEWVQDNHILSEIYKISGATEPKAFLFILGIFVLCFFVISILFKAVTNYVILRFCFSREYTIGRKLIEGYTTQPFEWFLGRNSADLSKTILSEASTVVIDGLIPTLNLIAQSAVVVAILITLFWIDPQVVISIILVLGIVYIALYKALGGFMLGGGKSAFESNKNRFTAVSETFGAIKEIKISGRESVFIERFSVAAREYAKNQAYSKVISDSPKFMVEAIAFGGMLAVCLYLMSRSGDFVEAVPIISIYAFAGYRLMPSLQLIYASFSRLKFVGPALDNLHKDLSNLEFMGKSTVNKNAIKLHEFIRLEKIEYSYPSSENVTINNVSLTLPSYSTVGFVGLTGSGKTTIVDIILGLLRQDKGTIKVDGVEINEFNRHEWQESISYVPQSVYLVDDTVTANIAFGLDSEMIDHKAVENAAKMADIHDFVNTTLPNGYETVLGERGTRLSGGQCQRIGIARALYKRPNLLVLDEATSALDNITERKVMSNIYSLNSNMTVIIVAHRISTVKECDKIYVVHNGEIAGQGSFDQLAEDNKLFRTMISDKSGADYV